MLQVPPCPGDYRQWLQSMYCNFGQKWMKLHHGPMWSVAPSMQPPASESSLSGHRSAKLPIAEVECMYSSCGCFSSVRAMHVHFFVCPFYVCLVKIMQF